MCEGGDPEAWRELHDGVSEPAEPTDENEGCTSEASDGRACLVRF